MVTVTTRTIEMLAELREKVLLVDDRLSEALTGTLIDCTRVGMETELVIGRVEGAEPPAENNGAAR